MSVLSPAEARDMVQHQILAALAEKQETNPRMCFKGGTLLRACWAEQYRFSEDLDFDWIGPPETANKDRILVFLLDLAKLTDRRYSTECEVHWGSQNARVEWRSKTLGSGRIKIDINRNMAQDNLPETNQWELIDRYPGIDRSYPVLGYSLNSVVAAKLDCILNQQRAKSRDYYDMWRLLESDDLDTAVFVGQHLRRQNLTFDGPPGHAIMTELLEESFQAFDELDNDYRESRAAGLITDGPDSFEALLDEWEGRITKSLDVFDSVVENEQQTQQDQSLQTAIGRLIDDHATASRQKQARCGKRLPVANARCTLRKGHPGACRRDKHNG